MRAPWLRRKSALAAAVLLLALACGRPVERVVLISIDTLRADHVGAYGARFAHTPTLDALAARGVRFTNAFSPAPLTLPAHATLLTGLDPPQHGVRNNSGFRVSEEIPTLAERMQEGGFATAAFVGAFVLDRQYGLVQGFDVYDDRMEPRRAAGATGVAERRASEVVDAAVAWLEAAPARFFLFVHLYDPHANYDPPPGFRASFAKRPYDGEIAFVDAQLARLLSTVRERWPDGRTLVVATSDHGESLGEHGEATHAYTLYDATQRVPLLLAGPGLPVGSAASPVVRLVDVAPTILVLAGLDALADSPGRDLRGSLSGAEREPRTAYMETLATQLDFGWSPLLAVRTSRFKYVHAPRPELYDVEADPGERRDLAGSEPERTSELAALLAARVAETGGNAPALVPGPEERRRLRSLGYVVAAATTPAGELGRVGGPDPKDELPTLALLTRADALCESGRPREAWELVRDVKVDGVVAHSARARIAYLAGEYETAVAEARVAAAVDAADPGLHLVLGLALLGAGRGDEAEAALRESLRLDSATGDALVGLGVLAEGRGERSLAADLYAQGRAARSPAPEASWRLAALRIEDGAFDEAEALLAELPERELRRPEPALRVASAAAAVGRTDTALQRLDAALAAHPDSPALLRARGGLLLDDGRPEEAVTALEGALALAPLDPLAWNDLAFALATAHRDLERALALAERALGTDPSRAEFLDTLVTVRLARQEPEAALAAIDRAIASTGGAAPERLLELRRGVEDRLRRAP